MPTIAIPLDTCLLCNGRRVEEGDTVHINLDPEKFSPEIIEGYSPVVGAVTEVRVAEPPEPSESAFVIEVSVSSDDLPPGVETLEACCDIASVSCYDCCASLTDRVEILEEGIILQTSLGGNGAADAGKVAMFGPSGELAATETLSVSSPDATFFGILEVSNNEGQHIFMDGANSLIVRAAGFTGTKIILYPNASGTIVLGDGAGITNQTSFRSALGLTSTAILSQSRILETEPLVTGLTGGGSTNLDGVATTSLPIGTKRRVFVSNREYIYELVSGTDAEVSPSVIRPDDFNSLSNAKVWKPRGRYAFSADISDSSLGGNGISDSGKLAKFSSGGELQVSEYILISQTGGSQAALTAFNTTAPRTWDGPDANGNLALIAGIDGVIRPSDVAWTATNDSATAGDIGECISSINIVGPALSTSVVSNLASISLTAGDWDVEGVATFDESSATMAGRTANISTTTATIPDDGLQAINTFATVTASNAFTLNLIRRRLSLSTTTTVYLCAVAVFSAGTVSAFGSLIARRVR